MTSPACWIRPVEDDDLDGLSRTLLRAGSVECGTFDRVPMPAGPAFSAMFWEGTAAAFAVCRPGGVAAEVIAMVRQVDLIHRVGWVDAVALDPLGLPGNDPVVIAGCAVMEGWARDQLGLRRLYFEFVACRRWRPAPFERGTRRVTFPDDTLVAGSYHDRIIAELEVSQ